MIRIRPWFDILKYIKLKFILILSHFSISIFIRYSRDRRIGETYGEVLKIVCDIWSLISKVLKFPLLIFTLLKYFLNFAVFRLIRPRYSLRLDKQLEISKPASLIIFFELRKAAIFKVLWNFSCTIQFAKRRLDSQVSRFFRSCQVLNGYLSVGFRIRLIWTLRSFCVKSFMGKIANKF